MLRDTHGGGGNIINTALAVLAFLAAERQRPRTAGVLLAFSLVTKPTLVWLLPVFWLFGHRRVVLATALAAAAMVLATMALQRFELLAWSRWLQGSLALLRQSDAWAVPAYEFPPFEWMNQALRFAVARWGGTVPNEFAAKVPGGIAAGLGLAPEVVVWLTRTASALLLGSVVWTAWRTRAVPSARLWTTAAALALTLLLSPLSWKGHHVALLPVLLLLLHDAVQWRRKEQRGGAVAVVRAVLAAGRRPGRRCVRRMAEQHLLGHVRRCRAARGGAVARAAGSGRNTGDHASMSTMRRP